MKAYPFIHKDPTSGLTRMEEGMELRDWFAGLAIQGMFAVGGNAYEVMAQRAYEAADAMMKQRKEVSHE